MWVSGPTKTTSLALEAAVATSERYKAALVVTGRTRLTDVERKAWFYFTPGELIRGSRDLGAGATLVLRHLIRPVDFQAALRAHDDTCVGCFGPRGCDARQALQDRFSRFKAWWWTQDLLSRSQEDLDPERAPHDGG